MKKLMLCFCAALASFVLSCAPTNPEGPADQANKMRVHRTTPSEDVDENGAPKQGSTLPSASDSTWKF